MMTVSMSERSPSSRRSLSVTSAECLLRTSEAGMSVNVASSQARSAFGQVRHLVPGARPLLVDPVEDLLRAEGLLAARRPGAAVERLEGLAGQRGASSGANFIGGAAIGPVERRSRSP